MQNILKYCNKTNKAFFGIYFFSLLMYCLILYNFYYIVGVIAFFCS